MTDPHDDTRQPQNRRGEPVDDYADVDQSTTERLAELFAEQFDTRRKFLSKLGVAGAGVAAATGSTSARAVTGRQGGSDGGSRSGQQGASATVTYLNYALALEHLEATFYRQGIEQFSASEFRNADILCAQDEGLNQDIPKRLQQISNHEQAHVKVLTKVVKALGGEPAPQREYAFGYETPSQFLQIARVLENTGVSAYDGALHFIGNNLGQLGSIILQTSGATIATVEARHASYLNTITQENPFPAAFDEPQSMDSILAKASPFIQGFKDDRQRFVVQVDNVSTKNTYDVGSKSIPVPLSPGAYAVHTGRNPLFTPQQKADKGTELIAEDGFPFRAAQTLAGADRVAESGVFSSFSTFPPAITPKESAAQFFVTGKPDSALSFETMFVPSNDLFIAPDGSGISLFENGSPVSGDVTDQLTLWDAGTEQNQEGVGPDAKPNQKLLATDVGPQEDKVVRPASEVEGDDHDYPAVSEVVEVTVTPM